MICMIWPFILWIFFVWKVYSYPWWIEDESGRDSGQKRKVSFGVSQGVATLVYIWQVWICLIDLLWFWESCNYLLEQSSLLIDLSLFDILILVIKLRDCIRSTLVKICLGVVGGVCQVHEKGKFLSFYKIFYRDFLCNLHSSFHDHIFPDCFS